MQRFPSKPEGLATALELCVLRGFEVKYVDKSVERSFTVCENKTYYKGYVAKEDHYIVTRMIPDRRGLDARMMVIVTQDKQGLDHCLALLRVPDSKLRLIAGETITVNMDYAVTAA